MGGNAGRPDVIEKLSTCLALIEIVDSCNLACPTCFADSPAGAGSKVQARPLRELQNRINGVIARKGRLEILQLSGGEPTLHPDFFELARWAQEHPQIDMLLINTNGVRIAQDDEFLDGCAAMAARLLRGAGAKTSTITPPSAPASSSTAGEVEHDPDRRHPAPFRGHLAHAEEQPVGAVHPHLRPRRTGRENCLSLKHVGLLGLAEVLSRP